MGWSGHLLRSGGKLASLFGAAEVVLARRVEARPLEVEAVPDLEGLCDVMFGWRVEEGCGGLTLGGAVPHPFPGLMLCLALWWAHHERSQRGLARCFGLIFFFTTAGMSFASQLLFLCFEGFEHSCTNLGAPSRSGDRGFMALGGHQPRFTDDGAVPQDFPGEICP